MEIIEIKTLEIPKDKIRIVDFEEFKGVESQIFKFEDNLLRESKSGWIMTKNSINNLQTTNKEDLNTTKTNEIIKWCKKFKYYIDTELDKIKKEQEQLIRNQEKLSKVQGDMLESIKNYIDNKIKE